MRLDVREEHVPVARPAERLLEAPHPALELRQLGPLEHASLHDPEPHAQTPRVRAGVVHRVRIAAAGSFVLVRSPRQPRSARHATPSRYGRDGRFRPTPCATSGSARWYFTYGQTLVNAGEEISLLNPYPADSVVDLSFTTDQGVEFPVGFQGIVVPAGGLVSVNIGDHLRRRQQIATTVIARTGRVVAWEFEGDYYDTGTVPGYLRANLALALKRKDLRESMLEVVGGLVDTSEVSR